MQHSLLFKIIKQFKPVDVALIAYLLITLVPAILIVLLYNSGFYTLTIHIILVLLITGIALASNLVSKEWFKTVRLFYPLLLLGFLYTETDFLNNLFFIVNLDPIFASIEKTLFGIQPSLVFSKQFPSNLCAETMYFGYFVYYLMIIGLPLFWYFKRDYKFTEKFVFVIIQSFLIFYLFFDVIPVAGPQYYFSNTEPLPQGYLFGFLIRTIQQTGEAPTAAFPSSHVALCLIMIYMVSKVSVKMVFYLLPIVVLLIFSTVYIRAHYVVDILASFLVAPIVYLLSLNLYQKLKSWL